MSIRRLGVLASRLPPESALAAALAGGREKATWSTRDEIAAQAHELVQNTNHILGAAHLSDKSHPNPVREPKPAPRPGDTGKEE